MKVILNDKGMTIVELLFATLLMAFVLIALMSLMMGAVTASTFAKNQTRATALANERIEVIRGMLFVNIGISGSTNPNVPDGTLPSAHQTTTIGGQTYEYWYEVVWVDDVADNNPQTEAGSDDDSDGKEDYKRVTVYVTWSGSPRQTVKVVTNVRKKDASTTAPTVSFVSPTPSNLTPVSGNSVPIAATATDTDGQIVVLRFYFEGHTPTGANFTENSSSVSESFTWDTTETYVDEYGATQYYYPDGAREVKVQVWDNAGATSYWEVYLLVDNFAPTFPVANPLSGSGSDYNKVALTWKAAVDGTDRVEDYFIYRSTDGVTWTKTSVGASDLTYNPSTGYYSYDYIELSSWTNYQFYIKARSPLNVQSESQGHTVSSNTDTDNYTLIQLTGNGNDRRATLNWTAAPGGVTCTGYDIYRNGSYLTNTATNSYVDTSVARRTTYTYQIKAKNGASVINTSNVLSVTISN